METVIGLFPAFAGLAVAIMGLSALIGWAFDIQLLKTIVSHNMSMKANTALGFLLSGVSLYLLGKPRFRVLQIALAIGVLAVASLTLVEYLTNVSLGIDEILVRDLVSHRFPGRMAPISALSFLFVSVAFLLASSAKPMTQIAAQCLLVLTAIGPAFGIVGYIYGVPVLYGSLQYTAMAFHTGVGFLVLVFGILFVNPRQGIMRIFLSDSSGGVLARIAVPASIALPILLGAIFVRPEFNFGYPRLGNALTVISSSTVFAGLLWSLSFFLQSREIQWERSERHANMDSLTGVMNRRYFEKRLNEEIARCERNESEFTVMLFDVDRFKALNDTRGHLVGDQILTEIALILRRELRTTDIVCRYGGEEFVVMAFDADERHVLSVAENLRKEVEEAILGGSASVRMTVSAGIARYPQHGATRASLLNAADAALYLAKNAGRNRILSAI